MTYEEIKVLPTGLYVIYWTDGTFSKAVVQESFHGSRLFSCHDWSGNPTSVMLSQYANEIERMVFVL